MGSITDKANYLKETKRQIKTAIQDKGVEVSDTDTFRSYATKINAIQTTGAGIPKGGKTNEVLAKKSDADYDVGWSTTTDGDLQSQIDVLNNKLSTLQNIEVKACTLADGVTGEVVAYRFGGNIIYIVGQVILSSVSTGVWNPICTIPFRPQYTNRSTDFSIENNANDIATHARILNNGALSVYPTTTTISGSGSTDISFFISHFYY